MSRYEQLVQELRQTITPDDVVGAMLSQVTLPELPTDSLKIHGAIQRLRNEFPDLLSDFVFFQGNLYPFSDLLERVLFRLESSSILGTVNPAYEIYNLTKETKEELARRVFSRFSADQQARLKELAGRFEAEVGGGLL